MFDTQDATFVTALGTPLDNQGNLLEDSFRRHLDDQIDNGQVAGFLVLGTMGQMPCLRLSTYQSCARTACDQAAGRAKILIGVGDNSLEQTMDRIEMLQGLKVDAVVATAPYYFVSSQKDLLYYFTEIADRSPFPLFLYDLPQATKVRIELPTALKLSEHPNIKGAKCSYDPVHIKQLIHQTAGSDFQVVPSQYDLIDVFLAYGLTLHLDGFYGIMAPWLKDLKEAYAARDFQRITERQLKMTALRNAFLEMGVFPGFTEALNLLGFKGRFHPSHLAPLDEPAKAKVKELLLEAGLL